MLDIAVDNRFLTGTRLSNGLSSTYAIYLRNKSRPTPSLGGYRYIHVIAFHRYYGADIWRGPVAYLTLSPLCMTRSWWAAFRGEIFKRIFVRLCDKSDPVIPSIVSCGFTHAIPFYRRIEEIAYFCRLPEVKPPAHNEGLVDSLRSEVKS